MELKNAENTEKIMKKEKKKNFWDI